MWSNKTSVFATELEILAIRGFGVPKLGWSVIVLYPECQLRHILDSVPPDTSIRDIVNQCRRLLTVTNVSWKYPTVSNDFRGPSALPKDIPVISGNPGIEPLVPVTMVWAVPLEEPTILEVLAQRILDQTVNCGEKSPKVTGIQSTVPSIRVRGVGVPLLVSPRISRGHRDN